MSVVGFRVPLTATGKMNASTVRPAVVSDGDFAEKPGDTDILSYHFIS